MEEGGEDTKGDVCAGGEEVSIVGGMLEMLAVGKVEGAEVAVTAETDLDWVKA